MIRYWCSSCFGFHKLDHPHARTPGKKPLRHDEGIE